MGKLISYLMTWRRSTNRENANHPMLKVEKPTLLCFLTSHGEVRVTCFWLGYR